MPGKKCRKKLFGACAVSVLLGCGRGPSMEPAAWSEEQATELRRSQLLQHPFIAIS